MREVWPDRWIERFEANLAKYCGAPRQYQDPLAWTLTKHVGGCDASDWMCDRFAEVLARCESPLERAFLGTAIVEWAAHGLSVYCGPPRDSRADCRFLRFPPIAVATHAFLLANGVRLPQVVVYPQLKIGRYRTDFFVVRRALAFEGEPLRRRTMVIECDGHDYHERSKEQARSDKARDRYMQARGHLVFRFSGSDIWNDSVACVREAFAALVGGRS